MNPNDPNFDPIVEILRLAYRRGLAILREQKEKQAYENKTADSGSPGKETLSAEQDPTLKRKDSYYE